MYKLFTFYIESLKKEHCFQCRKTFKFTHACENLEKFNGFISVVETLKNNVQKRAYKTVIENDTSKITLPTSKNDEKLDNTHKNEISEDFGSLQEKICGTENFYYLHDRATHFLEEIPKLREIQRTHVPCPFCDLLFLDDFYMQVHMGLEHMPNLKKTGGVLMCRYCVEPVTNFDIGTFLK